MPFKSKAQAGAAFGGHLGPEMKKKAHKWAKETPNMEKLPKHVEETTLNEAQLASNVPFWVARKYKNSSVSDEEAVDIIEKEDLVFESDPISFGRLLLSYTVDRNMTPQQYIDTIIGFYTDESAALNAAQDQIKIVQEAAKALEEKKGMVTSKIEEVIKKLQEKVNRCMEEGLDEEAQVHLQKISELRSKSQMVEASKKPIEDKKEKK